VGQPDYIDQSGAGRLNQGVQQSDTLVVRSLLLGNFTPVVPALFRVRLYPNPTTGVVTLDLLDGVKPGMAYALYTTSGQFIAVGQITSAQQKINLPGLSQGVYFLNIIRNGVQLKSFSIRKIR
jgi:hypothetical protein